VTLTASSTLRHVVEAVSKALKDHGIRAVLTGGACASLHARGDYLSQDLDYIVQGRVTQAAVETALRSVGFSRHGASYQHPHSAFFVEFPVGPLAIGADDLVEPVTVRVGRTQVLSLSATDSCRDRLAAFYHWADRQSLDVAVRIAIYQRLKMPVIRAWSIRQGHEARFAEFEAAVRTGRGAARKKVGRRPK